MVDNRQLVLPTTQNRFGGIMPESFRDCLSYADQIAYLYQMISEIDPSSEEGEISNLKERVSSLESAVNSHSLSISQINSEINTIKSDIIRINSDLNTKQDKLTAGENIEINGNEISAPAKTLWRPSVDNAGNMSWEKSDVATPPATQNIRGPVGQTGNDGVTPVISATASVDQTTGTPAVEVVKTGTDAAPSFAFNFSNLKGETGETGAAGTDGISPVITAAATVDANTGTPAVQVVKTGTDANPILTFNFTNLRGPQGLPGTGENGIGITDISFKEVDANGNYVYTITLDNGQTYDFTSPKGPIGATGATPVISSTASVDANTGTPSVQVVKTGTDEAPSFAFNFSNIKGETGSQGPVGQTGNDGVTPVISASASVDQTTGTPACNVTKSGTDAAPSFAFAFTGIKGEQGVQGNVGPSGVGISSIDYKEIDANGNYVYTITLSNNNTYDITCPKGPVGQTGQTGATGETPVITATATVDANTGTPAVNVVKTGTDVAPSLAFNFSNLKGNTGSTGVGITSIDFKNTDASGNNVYTITLSDGSTYDFTAPRGPQGSGAGGTTWVLKASHTIDSLQTELIEESQADQFITNHTDFLVVTTFSNGSTDAPEVVLRKVHYKKNSSDVLNIVKDEFSTVYKDDAYFGGIFPASTQSSQQFDMVNIKAQTTLERGFYLGLRTHITNTEHSKVTFGSSSVSNASYDTNVSYYYGKIKVYLFVATT